MIQELKGLPILIMDDDQAACESVCLILNDAGMRSEWVLNGKEGIERINSARERGQDYFAIIVDWKMPGMDGIEATRRLRALPQPPHVLILTSLSPSGTVERAVEAGAEGFVSKTDAPEDIIRRITDVCDGLPQFNPSSQRQLINDLNMQQPQSRRDEARAMLDALPEREREAVVLAADGYTNAGIAERMFISERTVKAHISSAGDRLCMGRVQMARLVERADLPDQL